ncbi:MAG: penicillin-binding protein 2 [Parcubacteria group bacterium CG10_big_fil_rev_8_21_14_0_10_36_14]|nr:MAG: penicillin-binding protein 2 [Parcubacteria group bacterium CG10_big_fil_rev_8_21_14_0_10_36_14]
MQDEDIFGKNNLGHQKYKLNKTVDNNWIESSYGKYSWIRNTPEDESTEFLGASLTNFKLKFVGFLIIFISVILFGKVFYLQIVKGKEYIAMAETNRIRQVPILAERGVIYDRNQKALVGNAPNFYLALVPNDLPKDGVARAEAIKKIADIANLLPQEIEEQLSAFKSYNYQSIPIKNDISYEQAVYFEILNNTYPAIQVKTGLQREYSIPESMSHIIGYLRKITKDDLENDKSYLPVDDIGKSGVEAQYESVLRGEYGKQQIEVDAIGKEVNVLAKKDPIRGSDIIISIDSDFQNKVQTILQKHLRAHGLSRGSVIISDVSNGEIISMVSSPAYDNNLFSGKLSVDDYKKLIENPNKPLFNRSISGEYPSGSTIKPVFAVAALEENIITEKTNFRSSGGIKVGEWFFPDWKIGGHGLTNVRKAIAESVNTFFYIIGGGLLDNTLQNFTFEGLGVAKLADYAKKFGLSAKLGIDLPSESEGFLPSKEWKERVKKESWYIGDTYHLAIGQGDLLVTPLQVNFFTLAFANGGTLYQPHILKTIMEQDGSAIVNEPIVLNKNFISQKNINIIRQGLRDSVLYGSSRALSDLSVEVAGKTGTAEWRTNKTPHAWFTGFAPYDNPKIAITVLIEEGGEGSQTAVPIAKEILWWYFNM